MAKAAKDMDTETNLQQVELVDFIIKLSLGIKPLKDLNFNCLINPSNSSLLVKLYIQSHICFDHYQVQNDFAILLQV
jgi:hypothetical protein